MFRGRKSRQGQSPTGNQGRENPNHFFVKRDNRAYGPHDRDWFEGEEKRGNFIPSDRFSHSIDGPWLKFNEFTRNLDAAPAREDVRGDTRGDVRRDARGDARRDKREDIRGDVRAGSSPVFVKRNNRIYGPHDLAWLEGEKSLSNFIKSDVFSHSMDGPWQKLKDFERSLSPDGYVGVLPIVGRGPSERRPSERKSDAINVAARRSRDEERFEARSDETRPSKKQINPNRVFMKQADRVTGPHPRTKLQADFKAGKLGEDSLLSYSHKGPWEKFETFSFTGVAQASSPAGQTGARPSPAGKSGIKAKLLKLLQVFGIVTNPGILIKKGLKDYPWPWALGVSGVAYMLFFFQVSLDLKKVEESSTFYPILMMAKGFLYGTLGVAGLAILAFFITSIFRQKKGPDLAVKSFGLSYAPALVYTIFGILTNIFLGWNTALSFGLPGVLWAARPMRAAFGELSGGKRIFSLVASLAFAVLVALGWSWLI